jgi:iron complex outermembrane recepter protein
MRIATVLAVALLGTTSLAGAEHAQAAIQHYQLNIPRQSLDTALKDLAQQTGLQIGRFSGRIDGSAMVGPVLGDQTPAQALKTLLNNTGLEYKIVSDTMIAVYNPKDATSAQVNSRLNGTEEAAGGEASSSSSDDANTSKEAGKKTSHDFRVAQVDQGANSQSSAVGSNVSGTQENENKGGLAEITVTAQKREERQQDVPIAMTVLDPQTLSENGQARLLDYFATVPGLSVQGNGFIPGTMYLTIRGLSTGINQNSTVATIIDDVPVGSGSEIVFGNFSSPDIDPSDLARIEVLKGPQGTLYGADSLGGLIKYVTADPSTAGFSGRIEAGGVDIPEGGVGYAVRGAVNIPVSDTLAIHASGFTRRDPGYADDVLSGQTNINSADVYGGRLAALWRPSDDISLKVSGLIQQTDGDGGSYFNARIGPNGTVQPTQGYLNYTGEAFANPSTRQQQLYSATLKAKVGGADLVSVTGYGVNKIYGWRDEGTLYDSIYDHPADLHVTGIAQAQGFETDKFTQELRLSYSVGHWLDWLLGGFYTHENSPVSYQTDYNMTPATGAVGNLLANFLEGPYTVSEYAAFADVTVHFTDRFNVQLGGRESWNTQTYESENIGPAVFGVYGVPSPDVNPTLRATGNAFTYLVTPQFKISPDLMIYARVASGYRIGGPNFNYGQPGVPQDYKPDTTTNYEFGVKGDILERRLSFDASAYYISWHDFQLAAETPNDMFFETNAGQAKSEGLEFSVQAQPMEGFTVSAQGSYNDAALTQNLPPQAVAAGAYALAGDRLPYSIRWSGGFTANQDFPLLNQWKGFVGGALTYVGIRDGEFAPNSTTPRAQFPDYTKIDLRTGVRFESWLLNLYVNNVGDKRGIAGAQQTFGAVGVSGNYYGTIIQPRTVGMSIVRNF